jgi:hypothetical protein
MAVVRNEKIKNLDQDKLRQDFEKMSKLSAMVVPFTEVFHQTSENSFEIEEDNCEVCKAKRSLKRILKKYGIEYSAPSNLATFG